MPSSTSNSSHRIPDSPAIRMWGLSACVLVTLLIVSEISWRKAGHLPSVSDSKALWSMHRNQVYTQSGQKALVVIGASRAQLGIDPKILKEEFPEFKVIHLAIDGVAPYAVLRDLSLDPNFDGLVLCSTTASGVLPTGDQCRGREYVSYYHNNFRKNISLTERINVPVSAYLQERFVTLSSQLRLDHIVEGELNTSPSYQYMRSDRFRPAFYNSRMTEKQRMHHRHLRIERIKFSSAIAPDKDFFIKFQKSMKEVANWHTELLSREGRLVFIRMPTTDEHWSAGEIRMPKKDYWDKITALSGIPTVHFKDYNELSDYKCPDTSHLDGEDAPEFTRRLAHIIKPMIKGGREVNAGGKYITMPKAGPKL